MDAVATNVAIHAVGVVAADSEDLTGLVDSVYAVAGVILVVVVIHVAVVHALVTDGKWTCHSIRLYVNKRPFICLYFYYQLYFSKKKIRQTHNPIEKKNVFSI